MHPGIVSWKKLLAFAFNFFPIPLLFKTLFTPWERDTASGSHFSIFERAVFAVFSRVLGFVARAFLIFFGLILSTLSLLALPIFLLLPIELKDDFFNRLGGFGAELSFGNTFKLNAHSRDLLGSRALRIYGKEKALRMVERGLSKDTNHNVLLVGDVGVGKTTLVGHLGRLGKSGLAFSGIRNKRVVELSTENLSASDFDEILAEAAKAGNIVLVMENIHLYTPLFERLLPYLNAPELGIIATTDFAGYDRILKAHPEFLSKFEKVDVLPTGPEETLLALRNVASLTETRIRDEALREIVRLSERYIGNLAEPERSISVLMELRALHKTIEAEDVRQVVSDKVNIPIGELSQDEGRALASLEDKMKQEIIAQDEAVADLSQALKRLRTGVADPKRPAGTFLFLGPTGVGKTHTAKILARTYFGREEAMIRFDMSEFALPESVPIFVDRLAAVIEEAPFSLVFFDELEKANRLIHNLLLQVLDEGRITRESGREASFKNTIIIATSNAGSSALMENPSLEKRNLIDQIIRANIFTPEFINRFSGVVLFRPLGPREVRRIALLLLSDFSERLFKEKKIRLEITDALVDRVAGAGFDPEFGARPIRRAIEEIVENRVAELILQGKAGEKVKII